MNGDGVNSDAKHGLECASKSWIIAVEELKDKTSVFRIYLQGNTKIS